MRCSVLDLGSNSFHVLVADLDGRIVSMRLFATEFAAEVTIHDEAAG